jgi:hypothetical protein
MRLTELVTICGQGGTQQAQGSVWSGEHIYWVFSSAAQCVATCIAFLLSGYAIVITMMESARQKDDSLAEIHAALRAECHTRLRLLALVNAVAITMNLACVFLNRWGLEWIGWLVMATVVIDLVVVFWCLTFVLTIVDPNKYEKVAGRFLRRHQAARQTGQVATAAEFFNEFRLLERCVADLLRVTRHYEPTGNAGGGGAMLSFREMVDLLMLTELATSEDGRELLEINKYRNLVFHGHVDETERGMMDRVRAARRRIEQTLTRYQDVSNA